MSMSDKNEVQRQVLKSLADLGRYAFRGPLALRLILFTSDKNPTHSHHIAKNLLDLFGKPRSHVATNRRGLLYMDDRQVHALSVTCHHGRDAPGIIVDARPLSSLIEDLDLAMQIKSRRDNYEADNESEKLDEAIEQVKDFHRRETQWRRMFGDQSYESMIRWAHRHAQEALLGQVSLTPLDLAHMYNASDDLIGNPQWFEQLFAATPLRIRLNELPQVDGSSDRWKAEIDERVTKFKERFGWLIDPLLVPVALEVVIKPSPLSRQRGLHDLDNVLRTYLIPRVVEILKPVSHHAFTIDMEAIKRDAPELVGRFGAPPPLSTKAGVTRYEAWRLPPATEGSQGFVSVGVVRDITGHGDIFGQIDDEIEKWVESLP